MLRITETWGSESMILISKGSKIASEISSEEKLLKPPKLNISQIVGIIASAAIDPTDVVAILQELLSCPELQT